MSYPRIHVPTRKDIAAVICHAIADVELASFRTSGATYHPELAGRIAAAERGEYLLEILAAELERDEPTTTGRVGVFQLPADTHPESLAAHLQATLKGARPPTLAEVLRPPVGSLADAVKFTVAALTPTEREVLEQRFPDLKGKAVIATVDGEPVRDETLAEAIRQDHNFEPDERDGFEPDDA